MDTSIRDERTWIDVTRDSSICRDIVQATVQWRNIVFAKMLTSLTTQERHWIKIESFIPLPFLITYSLTHFLQFSSNLCLFQVAAFKDVFPLNVYGIYFLSPPSENKPTLESQRVNSY